LISVTAILDFVGGEVKTAPAIERRNRAGAAACRIAGA
jgi:hypothetical protein